MTTTTLSAGLRSGFAVSLYLLCFLGAAGCSPKSSPEIATEKAYDQKSPVANSTKSAAHTSPRELAELHTAVQTLRAELDAVRSEGAQLRAELKQAWAQFAQRLNIPTTLSDTSQQPSVSHGSNFTPVQQNAGDPRKSQNKPTFLPNSSGIPRIYNVSTGRPEQKPEGFPAHGSTLNVKQFQDLMEGNILFSPQSIPPSGKTVTDNAPLQVGQEVLLEWKGSWWAGTVTGFEPDGAVRVRYFGWDQSWDEAVPRSDIQLGTNTRETAIQTVYTLAP
jgi:hypothetical protein